MMLSFLLLLASVLWCFSCRSATRAWLGILAGAALLGGLDVALHWARHS
jgi:hypothetical protein